jgi:hypothetical protein
VAEEFDGLFNFGEIFSPFLFIFDKPFKCLEIDPFPLSTLLSHFFDLLV